MSRGRQSAAGGKFMGTIIFIVALGVGFLGYKELQDIRTLLETGAKAEALIVKVDMRSGNRAGDSTSYTPVVRWRTDSGEVIEKKAGFASVESQTYKVGEKLVVVYDTANPSEKFYVSEPGTSPQVRFTDYIMLIISVVFGAIGLLFFRSGVSTVSR